jgi:glycosyltransferase involved in cell wall biosynthesis
VDTSASPRRQVLLTVSGEVPADLPAAIERGRRPRADYLVMQSTFGADLLDRATTRRGLGRLGRLLEKVAGPDVAMAVACFAGRRGRTAVFTDGEQVGLPYAALCWLARRRPRHVMIGHRLSAAKKVSLHRLLRLQHRIDVVVVYASEQRRIAIEMLGYPPDRVVLHPFMVDTDFWRPELVTSSQRDRPLICAVGQELRDYPTLVEAVRGLDVDVVVAAASPWSKRADSSAGLDIPANVVVRGCDHFELRQLYADSDLVVVPLEETDFQAGITTILEAMSMSRAIVCTRTTGQTDTIVDGETGRYVPVGDVAALRAAIEALLTDREEAARLGDAARQWVCSHADVTDYAKDLAELVTDDLS